MATMRGAGVDGPRLYAPDIRPPQTDPVPSTGGVYEALRTAASNNARGEESTGPGRSPWAEDGLRRGRGAPPVNRGVEPYLESSLRARPPAEPSPPRSRGDRDVPAGGSGHDEGQTALDLLIAANLEEHRVYEGFATQGYQLTHPDLAVRTLMSVGHVGKLLRGERRMTVRTLGRLTEALGLAPEAYEYLCMLVMCNEDPARPVAAPGGPPPLHLRNEIALTLFPKVLLTPGVFDVGAVNDAAARRFPGLVDSGNFLRWLFRDPVARTVLGQSWQLVAAVFTYGLHYLSRGVVPESARIALISELSDEEAFARAWSSRLSGAIFPLRVEVAVDPDRPEDTAPMTLTVSPWWRQPVSHLTMSLVPHT